MPAAPGGRVHRGDDVGLGAHGDLAEDGAGQRRRDGQRLAALGRDGDAGGQAVGLVAAGTQGRSGGGGFWLSVVVMAPPYPRPGDAARVVGLVRVVRPWSGARR